MGTSATSPGVLAPPVDSEGGPAPAKAGRRKPHRKSRTGCSECRRRRIKCGEQRPKCYACSRHDVPCVYPATSQATRVGNEGSVTDPHAGSPVSASQEAPVPPTGDSRRDTSTPGSAPIPSPYDSRTDLKGAACTFDMDDMLLLHHWSVSTSRTIYNSDQRDDCWQVVFPRIGFHEPFVMHGILSLSALHLAHVNPRCRKRRTMDAARHHNISLQGFQRAIHNISLDEISPAPVTPSDEASDALLACASLNVIYTLATLRPVPDEDLNPRARHSRALGTDLIPIVRGVNTIVGQVYERVRLGPLGHLLDVGVWNKLEPDAQTDDWPFQRLREMWTPAQAHAAEDSVYDETLHVLRRCRMFLEHLATMDKASLHCQGYNRGWASPLFFFIFPPEEYFVRLHQRQPPALVLFAYFGTLLHHLDQHWFIQGWGRDVVSVTTELLGDFWEPWLAWPRRVVNLEHAGV
ncbi:uncharacterized protein F5Z01DRAFT_376373 [Emericellopsis atlantica]|uniref:Zn(2)-C6 fungal-type domain-containing protein n=1 Tax=Emericellopsis atlantica TaxID=2614577 RepID=A0A9P7ZDZ4_9HYPO|nr:uncharacterized protein F5Z01DRAFT_376373 [Emericellopsis atlantica]KAG9250329.1 hypothetical protein F5Z01DRAFT_376373 [Emericellopsis atlantica]